MATNPQSPIAVHGELDPAAVKAALAVYDGDYRRLSWNRLMMALDDTMNLTAADGHPLPLSEGFLVDYLCNDAEQRLGHQYLHKERRALRKNFPREGFAEVIISAFDLDTRDAGLAKTIRDAEAYSIERGKKISKGMESDTDTSTEALAGTEANDNTSEVAEAATEQTETLTEPADKPKKLIDSKAGLAPRVTEEEAGQGIPFAVADTGYTAREARRRAADRVDAREPRPHDQQGNAFNFILRTAESIRSDRGK